MLDSKLHGWCKCSHSGTSMCARPAVQACRPPALSTFGFSLAATTSKLEVLFVLYLRDLLTLCRAYEEEKCFRDTHMKSRPEARERGMLMGIYHLESNASAYTQAQLCKVTLRRQMLVLSRKAERRRTSRGGVARNAERATEAAHAGASDACLRHRRSIDARQAHRLEHAVACAL